MSSFQQFLRRRSLYVVLFFLVAVLYIYGTAISPDLMSGFSQRATETDMAVRHPIGLPELFHAALRDGRARLLVSLLGLLSVGMALAGLSLALWGFVHTGAFSLRAIADYASGLRRARLKAIAAWSFGDILRVAALVVIMALLLPFVRTTLTTVRPTLGLDHLLWMTVAMLVLDGFAILTILTFAHRDGHPPLQVFGIGRRRAPRAIRVGLLRYLMLFPWLFLTLFLIARVAQALGYEPPVEAIHRLIFQEHRPHALQLTMLLACVVGPVAEELFFRGLLYAAIRHRASRGTALATTAAIFALIHTNLVGFLPIFLLGYLLADVYDRTGSLAGPIAIHVVHNTFLMSAALVMRYAMSVA